MNVLQRIAGGMSLAVLSNVAARAVHMLVAFAGVSLGIDYLGTEKYGLWMAASAFVFMFSSLADGGISLGLITATATARVKEGIEGVRRTIAAAMLLLLPISAAIVLLSFLVRLMPWQRIFNLSDEVLAQQAGLVVQVVVVFVAATFLANLVWKVRIGLQQLPVVNAWDAVASFSALPAMMLAARLEASLPWFVAAFVLTPPMVKLLGAALFLVRHCQYVPSRKDYSLQRARHLMGIGAVSWVIAVTQALATQTDQVLIAHLIGVEDVSTYTVMQRLFALPYILVNFFFAAYWPAWSEAAAQGRGGWVRSSFMRILWLSAAAGVVLPLLLVLTHESILKVWVGESIVPSGSLAWGMAAYAFLSMIVGACSTLLVSLDVRRPQMIVNACMLLVNLPVSFLLIPHLGAAGAVWGTAISLLVCMVLPYILIIPRVLRKVQRVADSTIRDMKDELERPRRGAAGPVVSENGQ